MSLPFNPHDPDDPGPGPYPKRPDRTTPAPRSELPPFKVAGDKGLTAPETNRAIPILHGTAKMQGTVIEQYSGILYSGFLKAPYWLPNNQYSIGDRTTANGNTYVATKAGISAASGTGPSGTGTNIIDGNTAYGVGAVDISVRWDFQSNGTFLNWTPSTAYNVQGLVTVVYANGNFYVCVVSGTSAASGIGPTGTDPNTNVVDNTCQWRYIPPGWHVQMAVAFCEGQIFGGHAGYNDAGIFRDYTAITNDYIQLFNGTPTGIGARNALFPTPDSVQRDDYSNVAVLLVSAGTGADNKITNIALELLDGVGVDDTHPDENPADIAIDLLSHGRRGAGWATARIDTTGTLGVGVTSYRTYCTANGLLLSWAIDTATPAIELLGMLLAATNSDPVWSNGGSLGGMLKIVPRGDQALTANGVTYTPVTTPLFNLTADDTIGPVEITHRGSSTAFNSIPIEYTDRALGYVRNTVDDPDMADVDKRGLQRGATVGLPQIIAPATAVMLSRIYAQRSLKVRNQYRFRLPHRFMLLEPTDVVTLADSVMGMPARPVRITAMEEEQTDGTFLFEAEDYPVAVHVGSVYPAQTGDGFAPLRGTTVARSPTLTASTATGTIADEVSTRGAAVHNVWPNPTSEDYPPNGVNATSVEWAGRVTDATAFAGGVVRQLTVAATHAQQFIGDLDGTATAATDESQLAVVIPCQEGDSFYMEAMARFTAGAVNFGPAGVGMTFLNNANASTGTYNAIREITSTGSFPEAWRRVQCTGSAQAGTTKVRLYCRMVSQFGAVTAQFDAISVRMQPSSASWTDGVSGGLVVGAGTNTYSTITSLAFMPHSNVKAIVFHAGLAGFATGASGKLEIALFNSLGTQIGAVKNIFYNTLAQHQGWSLAWSFVAGTLGPAGSLTTLSHSPYSLKIRSPTGSACGFTMDANDSFYFGIEEVEQYS